jgi:hypothetical protein
MQPRGVQIPQEVEQSVKTPLMQDWQLAMRVGDKLWFVGWEGIIIGQNHTGDDSWWFGILAKKYREKWSSR